MEQNLAGYRRILVGIQMLFVAFGALVLVPLLTGLDPSIALLSAGIGTLIFQLVTRASVPVFLASSFAFIAPIQFGIKEFGLAETMGGLASAGLVYLVLAGLVKWRGPQVIERFLPPVVTGPVIMVIGLKLAPVAVGMTKNFGGSDAIDPLALLVALITLTATIVVVIKGKKLFSLIPILIGISFGYAVSLLLGVVNWEPIRSAAWISLPWIQAIKDGSYALPAFNIAAILYILPVALAPAIEHVGDIIAISSVTGEDYLLKPGLHRTLAGDGLATTAAALLGGPPNTTYSEVTGAVALLKVKDVGLMRIAAITAIVMAFFGKLNGFLKTIPVPVMGGIMVLLFGMIAVVGINSLVRAKVDLTKSRNLVIAAVILVFGIGDMSLGAGEFQLAGIGLAGVVGVLLNAILPTSKENS
ncbi:MAG TPA: uracil-xanthine permease family protein [bacterium]|jgi:uracil permease|nr:uracil-xanthine permease family protein [bacterium]HNT66411.1 uracil-xanthine permease family protein [bacterium]HOX87639.1 uracil-xanthine permease family protein [bacterium]HPG47317.1 uracil-xanthine permease family protein [bacterium]HPM99589.1 uracil-xanthine permease family protein [bacterium]